MFKIDKIERKSKGRRPLNLSENQRKIKEEKQNKQKR